MSPESSKGHNSAGKQALLKEVTQEPDPVTLLCWRCIAQNTANSQSNRVLCPVEHTQLDRSLVQELHSSVEAGRERG